MSSGKKLRELMAQGMVVAPFVYDGFTAKIAVSHGLQAVYMTGHGTSAQIGLPDVGLTSFGEMVSNLRYIVNAVDVPVIADADTGYGNPINVRRTVREYEDAGAAALHIEDQIFPKKCGFFEHKEVVSKNEHVIKIQAALDARRDDDFVIIARTDALAPLGWDAAIDRCHAYYEAGADLVFVDGIKTADDLERYKKDIVEVGIPSLYNGGIDPTPAIASRGFKINITGGGHGLSFAAFRSALLDLKNGRGQRQDRDMARFGSMTDLLGLPEIYELERRYAV